MNENTNFTDICLNNAPILSGIFYFMTNYYDLEKYHIKLMLNYNNNESFVCVLFQSFAFLIFFVFFLLDIFYSDSDSDSDSDSTMSRSYSFI